VPQGTPARAGTKHNGKENKAILEVGGATSWDTRGGAATFAPNLAAEIEPIENWLELELVSPFYTHNSIRLQNTLDRASPPSVVKDSGDFPAFPAMSSGP
jgi:hypothetical protein